MGMHEGLIKVARLRVRGAGGDSLATRLRMERLMGAVNPGALGLPPSAILCVRRLGTLQSGGTSRSRRAFDSPVEWDRTLGSALRELLSRAARPVEGAVPADSEAVLFSDMAELLGCLALALGHGLHAHQWWWSGLYGSTDLRQVLLREWNRHPEYLPASLGLVARQGNVTPALSVLDEVDARGLLTALALRYGQRALLSETEASRIPEAETTVVRAEHGASAMETEGYDGALALTGASAPWEPWVQEVRAVESGLERRTLLGVSLMLHRAPMELRRPDFARALHAWRREQARHFVEASPRSPPPYVLDSAGGPPAFANVPPVAAASLHEAPGEASRASPAPARDEGLALRDTGAISEDGAPPLDAPAVRNAPTAGVMAPSEPPALPGEGVSGPPVELTPISSQPPSPTQGFLPQVSREQTPERAWGLPIPTGLGGLFYLVNLALFLELYGDFSRPMHPHLPLSLWDFVTLLGRRLLADPRPGDPVWKVLALLAGRKAGDAAGQGFEPPDAWRVPEEWLHAFRTEETQVWTWSAQDGRLRVLHPAGFLVVDVPRMDDDVEAQVQREVEPYLQRAPDPRSRRMAATSMREHAPGGEANTAAEPRFTLAHGEVPPPGGADAAPLERWLAWLVPYCRARLVRALGLTSNDALELEGTLFSHDARLHVSESHVDVVLALSQLPLAVRIAGLDRDIGWLPSAGRHLTFHFE
ncbi:hypothetical protein [Pyxidicoccus sp. MSG2]|uniref:hypothetical protein n=1 Tax=Pyxidicoccus sp. MSG2 TaxID=2996790 RepID=UPI00227215A0|nr:hypothetical protein [Pyxidicoccus sp. MSG2]MCY1022077.1 hypothetical protein [Pyxidicoccus sp. MSG2]